MIDSHCHLEQKDYEKDRDEVIERCRHELKAIITCCAHQDDFELTMEIVNRYRGFVFATVGIHPEYINEVKENKKEEFINIIKKNRDKIVGIGEAGLDYFWIKDEKQRERQKELFIEFIELAKEMNLPIVVHSRDAIEETIKILERKDAKNVHMHLFSSKDLLQRVIDNGWYLSIGPIIKTSKTYKKIARDAPLERIMLETDSPWFGFGKRNEPTSIKSVAEKIAEVRKINFESVWRICGENAIRFFRLPSQQYRSIL